MPSNTVESTPSGESVPQPQPQPPPRPIPARRVVLPLNTGTQLIRPMQTAMITVRARASAFRPTRLFVSSHVPRVFVSAVVPPAIRLSWWRRLFTWWRSEAILKQIALQNEIVIQRLGDLVNGKSLCGASDWLIMDMMIGNRSQFAQAGALPGDMFSSSVIDSFVTFDTAQVAMEINLIVQYRGPIENGVAFYGSLLGDEVAPPVRAAD